MTRENLGIKRQASNKPSAKLDKSKVLKEENKTNQEANSKPLELFWHYLIISQVNSKVQAWFFMQESLKKF